MELDISGCSARLRGGQRAVLRRQTRDSFCIAGAQLSFNHLQLGGLNRV
jgi:hypothetical protein